MERERCVLDTCIGRIALEAEEGLLARLDLQPGEVQLQQPATPVLKRAAAQITEYLDGRRRDFDIPLAPPVGTSRFQRRVWKAMEDIPYGKTRTYGELAKELETSPRAVGGACGNNPLPIVVPCHRVVAKGGLGGYSGDWESGMAVGVKKVLLELEGSIP